MNTPCWFRIDPKDSWTKGCIAQWLAFSVDKYLPTDATAIIYDDSGNVHQVCYRDVRVCHEKPKKKESA